MFGDLPSRSLRRVYNCVSRFRFCTTLHVHSLSSILSHAGVDGLHNIGSDGRVEDTREWVRFVGGLAIAACSAC